MSEFISAFRQPPDDTFINENGLVAQSSMVVEWDGKSISEELIRGMDNASALSWMSRGHSRHGVAAKIQAGVYFWIALRRIRISPFYLTSPRNTSSEFLTRTTGAELNHRANTQVMKRGLLGHRWREFVKLTQSFTIIGISNLRVL